MVTIINIFVDCWFTVLHQMLEETEETIAFCENTVYSVYCNIAFFFFLVTLVFFIIRHDK